MSWKLGAVIAAVVGINAMVLGLSQRGINAQTPKPDKPTDLKALAADSKLPAEARAAVDRTVYGHACAAWPMSDGTFYLGVRSADGKVHGFLLKTGDLNADAMVKVILHALNWNLRIGAYEDPKTGMLGGVCVFPP